jgi:hypothetical protein
MKFQAYTCLAGAVIAAAGIPAAAVNAASVVLTGGRINVNEDFSDTDTVTVSEGNNFLNSSDVMVVESLVVSGGVLAGAPSAGGIVDTGGNSITVSGGQLGGGLAIANDETVTVTGGRFFPQSNETIANLIQSGGEVGESTRDFTVTNAFTQTGGTTSGRNIGTGTFTQSGDGTIAAGTVLTAGSVQLQGGIIAGTLGGPGAVTVSGGTTRLTGSIVGTTALTVAGGRLEATGTGTIDTASDIVTVSGGTLVIDEGAFAPFNETLVIEGGTVTGGNLAVSSITQSGGLIAEGTTITTRSGSTLSGGVIAGTLTGDSLRSTVAFLSSGTTTLTGTMGGNISVGADATFDIKAGGFSNSEGQFYANLGTLNNAGTIATSGGLINEGVLRNSGTIDVGGLVDNRNSGTLQVDGTLTAGSVRSTGSMITGSGVIDAGVDLQFGSTIAPGNSPGTLTIDGNLSADASSVLAFELGGLMQGDDYDWLNVSGNVSLGQGAIFDIDYFGGFEAEAGDMFDILTGDFLLFSDLTDFAFDFADISTIGIDWSASIFDVESGRKTVRLTASSTVTPVPLPASGVLLLGGLAGLAALRRRKRAA